MNEAPLSSAVLEKVREQIQQILHLLTFVPADCLRWRPELATETLSLSALLGHLLECLAGVCAVLHAAEPVALAHFRQLKDLSVNHECGPAEAAERIAVYRARIEEGFACISDETLARRMPTLFVPEGEAVMTLLLGNLEHVINHKYQLFFYLKMLGAPVGTPDLYQIRGR